MLFLPPHLLNVSSQYVLPMLLWNCITITSIPPVPPPPLLSLSSLRVYVCVCYTIDILMGRPPCCDKSNVKKGPWTPEEDAKVLAYVANHGIGNWTFVPEKAGLNRCGKSCRLRWTNYLRPELKHDAFTPQEEEYILKLHKAIGSRWSLIAKHLPGRTDNDVKNHWNTKLRKKLLKMGIDPVTHKPFSQILTDFGNISGFPNTRNHFEPINNFMNNNSVLKPEASSATPEIPIPVMLNKFSRDSAPHFQVPNQETIQPHLFNDVSYSTSSSSSSSSSSSCNLGTQLSSPQSFPCQASQFQTILPSSPSSWSDYLLGDPSLPITNVVEKQQLFQGVISSTYPSLGYNNCSEATSDSFVDSILNRDSEMQSEFPSSMDAFELLSS